MNQEFDIPIDSPVSIPFEWEAAPGRPIVEAVPEVEPWMLTPLPPPPGVGRVTKVPSVSRFDGFEPEPALFDDQTQLTVKILKKLNRLRSKSMFAGACFMPDASRVMCQSGRLFDMDLDMSGNVDNADATSRSRPVTSTPEHYSATVPIDYSFSEPAFSRSTTNSALSSPRSTSAAVHPSSYSRFEDDRKHLEEAEGSKSRDDDIKTRTVDPGPCESAWHQPETPQKWQTRRPYSNLVPTFLRHSAPSHSTFKHLLFFSTFRKSSSKTANQRLDFDRA